MHQAIGGGVIFKDMLYGIGTGAVITGLALAVSDNKDSDVGRTVASGALIGGGLGVAYGIYEAGSRNCQASKPGWKTPRVYVDRDRHHSSRRYGVSLNYVFD